MLSQAAREGVCVLPPPSPVLFPAKLIIHLRLLTWWQQSRAAAGGAERLPRQGMMATASSSN